MELARNRQYRIERHDERLARLHQPELLGGLVTLTGHTTTTGYTDASCTYTVQS